MAITAATTHTHMHSELVVGLVTAEMAVDNPTHTAHSSRYPIPILKRE